MVVYLDNDKDREFFHVYFGHPERRSRTKNLLYNCQGQLFDTTGCADKGVGSVLLHKFLDSGKEVDMPTLPPKPMSTNFR